MKHLILLMMLTFYLNVNSQNYIYNYDFETADGGNSWPTGVAQADKMTSWETRTKTVSTVDLHSPDWIHSNGPGVQTILGTHPSAHRGNGMIGMTNYELIQQNFNNQSMNGDSYHTLSMWVYINGTNPMGSKDSRLKVMFSKNDFKYKSENFGQSATDLCTDKYTEYNNLQSEWTTIHEFDFNSLNLPFNSWQKISYTFKTPAKAIMNSYDYIVLELAKNGFVGNGDGGDFCQNSYIFIDDISLVETKFCDAACSPALGTITHGTFQNAMLVLGIPFNVILENAIGMEFRLFDRWGQQIVFEDAFDPNGLKDIGYQDYQFLWSGANSNGDPLFPEDVYNYTFRYWNCKEDHTIENSLTYLPNDNEGVPTYSNFHNYDLNDCCPDIKYIQNVTYIGDYIETAKNNIYAGYNVTPSTSNGNVVVGYGVDVKYISKNIDIQNGFSVMPGGSFTAIITDDCVYQSVQKQKPKERFILNDDEITKLNADYNKGLYVYPNPSNGVFAFKVLVSEIITIDIYNYYGSKILSFEKENFDSNINIEKEANGTYFYKVILSNGQVISGKLVKTD